MSFFTPLTKVLFVLMVTAGIILTATELQQWIRRRKIRKNLIKKAYDSWVDIASERGEWKIKSPFENYEHPHQQWFIRREVELYERYLRLKGNRTQLDTNYLAECRSRICDSVFKRPEG